MVAATSPSPWWRCVRAFFLISCTLQGPLSFAQASSLVSGATGATQIPTSSQNPVFGSVAESKPTPGVLPLTFREAIEQALRHNLAALLSEYNTISARGEKWKQLSELLPNVNGTVQEVAQKQSLEALGLRSGALGGGPVPRVIGPFSYFDARASVTQNLIDWKAIQQYRAAAHSETVAQL